VTNTAAWSDAATAAGYASVQWRAIGCSINVVVSDPTAIAAARAAVEAEIDRIDRAASRFREDSELSEVNRRSGDWISIGPALHEALAVAKQAALWTDGLVDPTVGDSLVRLGYDVTFAHVPADGPAISVSVSPAVGWRCINLSEDAVRIPIGVRLDLGATAKGLASDRAAAAAHDAAGSGVLVSLGGDIAIAGPVPERGWPVLVSDHSDGPLLDLPGGEGQTIALHGGGLATSGTRARRWTRGGSAFHHLIDPRSGLSTTGPWRTVSVTAGTCVDANAASTAAMVMGATAPTWLASNQLTARLVAHDGTVTRTCGWPTDGREESR
jgi:thiamine biosynthesis lipoprotein